MSSSDNMGIIVPIDVEAMCIGKDPGSVFQQNPFDFSQLNKPPYLSFTAKLEGNQSLKQGIHLHWALPDALTQGTQNGSKTSFPIIPDRWLVTRVFCDPSSNASPQYARWIIESNFVSDTEPHSESGRNSITVPFQGDNWQNQPWRHLGKVSIFEEWVKENSRLNSSGDNYAAGLTAVGYGIPEFAAGYYNCRNIFGFNDLAEDLQSLSKSDDNFISYHIIGWFNNPENDPVRQLPQLFSGDDFQKLMEQIINPDDKALVTKYYTITTYKLQDGVPSITGTQLEEILLKTGYPVDIEIPVTITCNDFSAIIKNTKDPEQVRLLNQWYLPEYGIGNIADPEKAKLWEILTIAGYDFLTPLLTGSKWSLPSMNNPPDKNPGYSLYSGIITNIKWNASFDYFTSHPADNFNIAVGNTPGEALSALIANTGNFSKPDTQTVEEILDALQSGILGEVSDESMLADWEELKILLHNNSFGSTKGGSIWEIKPKKSTVKDVGEITLDDNLADALNQLNIFQQNADSTAFGIDSMRQQIFQNWHQFMHVYHKDDQSLATDIQPRDLANYLNNKITKLNDQISLLNISVDKVNNQISEVNKILGNDLFLTRVSAPRFWNPNEPAILFQGNGIKPSDRYGNDGRFMFDDTLVCRLNTQLVSSVTVPVNAFGNSTTITIDNINIPVIDNPERLPIIDAINATLIDGASFNVNILAAEIRKSGVSTDFSTLVNYVQPIISTFLSPGIPTQLAKADFNTILVQLSPNDQKYWKRMYIVSGDHYTLNQDISKLTVKDNLRLLYLLISTSYANNPKLNFKGLPISEVGFQVWTENPWLPFSLNWQVNFFPLEPIHDGEAGYSKDFIISNFRIGDINLEYKGQPNDLSNIDIKPYSNSIFLTPHAGINLQNQLASFIKQHPDCPIKDDLNIILNKIGDQPVLAQSLSGLNEAFIMLKKELQLAVNDPAATREYFKLSNSSVKNAVLNFNSVMPQPDNSFNPIRTGIFKIDSVTIVDVFGRNVTVKSPANYFRPQSMIQKALDPKNDIYLAPRLVQPSRLLFRWLAADNDAIEMNSHPATSPICGWVLPNHLDHSLWVYDSKGSPYGSMILNDNSSRIIWQCTPGSPYFGYSLPGFLDKLDHVNSHFKAFLLAIYGTGGSDSATYLNSFMDALDVSSNTIEPSGYKQHQSNAVLFGRPLALVRASINLQLFGFPAYSQSWTDLENAVKSNALGNDYGFTNVEFPVKLGYVPDTEDGLTGYFKNDEYGTFYSSAVTVAQNGVVPPLDDNITVIPAIDSAPQLVSMLVDPRGKVHARTGILPVKSIEIPPDQYIDAIQKMELCFLTSPVLISSDAFAVPLPDSSGGVWAWVENDKDQWSSRQKIQKVKTIATMNYTSQQIAEGWLALSLHNLGEDNFSLVNNAVGKPVMYITNDPTKNILTFKFINNTDSAIKLQGGTPVNISYQDKGSSLVFNFSKILTEQVVEKLSISAKDQTWNKIFFPADNNNNGSWALAPSADMILAPSGSVEFTISGITIATEAASGDFQIKNYGFPDYPDSLAPITIFVSVINVQ